LANWPFCFLAFGVKAKKAKKAVDPREPKANWVLGRADLGGSIGRGFFSRGLI
jgi:hypothetical protein